MKANQKFTQADEAVSPVIGVILMVAITVVLAAVVFVLVSDLGDSGDSAPNVTFSKSQSDGTLTVVRADSGLTWTSATSGQNYLTVSGCTGVPSSGADVAAGNQLTGCSGSVTVTHEATNTLVYSTTF